MPELRLPRGYAGSGKSKDSTDWVDEQPNERARVNRDLLRVMLFGVTSGRGSKQQEQTVTVAEHAIARALLDRDMSVVVDSTNLNAAFARSWANLAHERNAEFRMVDIETTVDECIRRDEARGAAGGRTVGANVIRSMARRFPRENWPIIEADRYVDLEPYIADDSLPPAWIVDVDGTLATKAPGRGIYDYTRVSEDLPIAHTIEVVRKLAQDSAIIILSGRDDDCRAETADWLRANGVPFTELHMRATGDKRPDFMVKHDFFNDQLRDRFRILGAFDDRLQICRLWARLNVPLLRLGVPDHDDF